MCSRDKRQWIGKAGRAIIAAFIASVATGVGEGRDPTIGEQSAVEARKT